MDKQQIKARFFGAHIGCGVACYDEVKTKGLARGVAPAKNGAMLCDVEYHDNIIVPEFLAHCKLVLRHISSLTDREVANMDVIVLNSNRMSAYHNKIEYLRSINVATHFMGLDPIAEGWAILEEKIPKNA